MFSAAAAYVTPRRVAYAIFHAITPCWRQSFRYGYAAVGSTGRMLMLMPLCFI